MSGRGVGSIAATGAEAAKRTRLERIVRLLLQPPAKKSKNLEVPEMDEL